MYAGAARIMTTVLSGALQVSCSFSGESLCVIDSVHISAAVEEDMTVVILLSVRREGLDTHRHT